MSERKVIIVTGADTGSLSLQRAIVELVKASFTVIEAENPPAPPSLDFQQHLKILRNPKPFSVNNMKQLRRDQRAREKRTRKMLPKGKRISR